MTSLWGGFLRKTDESVLEEIETLEREKELLAKSAKENILRISELTYSNLIRNSEYHKEMQSLLDQFTSIEKELRVFSQESFEEKEKNEKVIVTPLKQTIDLPVPSIYRSAMCLLIVVCLVPFLQVEFNSFFLVGFK